MDKTLRAAAAVLPAALLSLAVAGSAGAQDVDAARALWDRFVGNCSAVVAATEPLIFAAGMNGGGGQAGRSDDGNVGMSSMMLEDPGNDGGPMVLIVTVNAFDEGRIVQCMMQVVQPVDDLSPLGAIARAEGGALLDGETQIAGGGLVEMTVDGGVPLVAPAGDEFEIVRIATTEFPAHGMLTVQVLPQVVILGLSVVQPADTQ